MAFTLNVLGSSHVSQREFANSQSAVTNAIQRLSSGLRVTRSSDDASGLGISEAVRSQIKGLDQSARNANDLISMTQVADGSLSQATDMLRRMRELATQARNASLSVEQKRMISDEISQLRSGINQVAEQSLFNGKSLLKNSLESQGLLAGGDRSKLTVGSVLAPGLAVSALDVGSANEGSYTVSFGTSVQIGDQKSRVSTAINGSLGTDNTQAISITGSGTSSAVLTLSGTYEAGDAIRFTVKGDSPDRTLVQTYTVTAENLTENNDGLSPRVAGDSLQALTNIASAMAAQYNTANALTSGDVDLDNKFSKPDAVASGATVTFSGSYNGSPLTAVTVGGYVINRPNTSREIIPTQADIVAGNRITVQINDLSYEYVVGTGATTESVAEGIRTLLARDYPHHATRAGSIVTVESPSGVGLADMAYQVRKAEDADVVQSISSYVDSPGASPASTRTLTISDNDVIAGRKFTLEVGNPNALRSYTVVAGTGDTASSIAQKFSTQLDDHYGTGATGITNTGAQVTFGSATLMGMANLSLTVTQTKAGELNGTVGPAQGITSAVWGVGGRLDDGDYQLSYNGSSWSVVASPVAGATFNGSVLTTSPGNAVNVRYTGTPQKGDTIFFSIANGDPTSGLGINGSATTGVPGIYNVADNDKTPNSVTVSGAVGTTLTATYNSSGYWSISDGDSNAYFVDAGRTSTSLSLYKYVWNSGTSSWSYSSTVTLGFNSSGNYPPMVGDQIIYSGSGSTAQYQRDGIQTMSFAVAGGLDIGDYTLEYNGSTTGSNYTIKDRFGDPVASATYSNGWLTLDSGDQVELVLQGTPQVGDKVYFTITGGNVITDRLIEGSNIGGRETSVSSQTRDRTDRVINIATTDIQVGRSVEISVRGKEYAVLVEAEDTASTVAKKLASLLAVDYPNTTSQNETTDMPAATRVSVNGSQITLEEPAKLGLDQIDVAVRQISNPGVITLTANSDTGIAGRAQSLSVGEISSGLSKIYQFDQLGIAFTLTNDRSGTSDASLFSAYSPRADTIEVEGLTRSPMAQLGASARGAIDSYLIGFGDIRITGANKNEAPVAQKFDQLAGVLDELSVGSDAALSDENFAKLINYSDAVLNEMAGFQAQMGVAQNRLEHAIGGIQNNSFNLQSTYSAIVEADYGEEMSKLVRVQIGQQAATAMMAQANLLPEVILSLLEIQPA